MSNRCRANSAYIRQPRPDYGSYLRFIDSCITQLKDQGPSRTCNESKEEEEEDSGLGFQAGERHDLKDPALQCRFPLFPKVAQHAFLHGNMKIDSTKVDSGNVWIRVGIYAPGNTPGSQISRWATVSEVVLSLILGPSGLNSRPY